MTSSPVHPRSRGEHLPFSPLARRRRGSSPLARGTHWLDLARAKEERFIPARAGNTQGNHRRPHSLPVHPRSRGEHGARRFDLRAAFGSSPLARGTLFGIARPRSPFRFIPARAGNTRAGGAAACAPAVHPRSRGEHPGARAGRAVTSGSSPLARGTQEPLSALRDRSRFIPARAGNTAPEDR